MDPFELEIQTSKQNETCQTLLLQFSKSNTNLAVKHHHRVRWAKHDI